MTVRSIEDAQRKRENRAWQADLITDTKGRPERGLANTLHALSTHPAWANVLAYDAFAECVKKVLPPPTRDQDGVSQQGEWTEADSTRTAAWFATTIGFEPTTGQVDQAVASVAELKIIHPVRDYLRGLTWDGVERLDRMLATYFGARDSAYAHAVGSRWMISAVARAEQPGCQADCMLVLESEQQGVGKSTGFAALAGTEWFADSGINPGEKDSYQALRAKWIYEFGELDAIKGREVTRVKNFVSARTDTYRPSYGRRTRDFPRQTVFCGTTNETEYLMDRTGNRRFWPVYCVGTVDVEGLRRDRDQLWAEALTRYKAGARWHVDTPELRQMCEEAQRAREIEDPWVPIVARWIHQQEAKGEIDTSQGMTTSHVMSAALNMRETDMRHDLVIRVGHVLRALGWMPRQRRREGDRVRLYFPPSQTSQADEQGDCDGKAPENTGGNHLSQSSHTQCTRTYTGAHARAEQMNLDSDVCDTVTVGTGRRGDL